ncbi:MAG: phospholipase [Mycetocola sp.]
MLNLAQKLTPASRKEARTSKKPNRAPMIVALAAAGILAASGITVQANSANAEPGATLSGALTGITTTLDGTTKKVAEAKAEQLAAEAEAHQLAEATIADANAVAAAAQDKVDTTPLTASVASLSGYKTLKPATVTALVSITDGAKQRVQAEVAEADRIAAEQAAAKAAAEAAAKAAAEAAEAAAAEQRASANTGDGARAVAAQMASSRYGWGSGEFNCLNKLWQKESGWSYTAYNASSGATGIPQALPGSKMATAGSDWKTNAATQIAWGLDYIDRAYGSPCAAWSHSQAMNWY